jgi:hypothetical protein
VEDDRVEGLAGQAERPAVADRERDREVFGELAGPRDELRRRVDPVTRTTPGSTLSRRAIAPVPQPTSSTAAPSGRSSRAVYASSIARWAGSAARSSSTPAS